MTEQKSQLYFDKENKIRAFDPTKFERTEQLEKECGSFVSNISTFNEKVHSLVEVLEAHASRIDTQKLKAIGLRMAVENEVENRHRQERALQSMINEKKAELDRYKSQLNSLRRVEGEYKTSLERLNNAHN
jgi:intraflagellar transport protein 20